MASVVNVSVVHDPPRILKVEHKQAIPAHNKVSVVHDPPRILKGYAQVSSHPCEEVSVVHDPPRILKVRRLDDDAARTQCLSRSRSAEDTERFLVWLLLRLYAYVSVVHDPPRILKGREKRASLSVGKSQSFTIRRGY